MRKNRKKWPGRLLIGLGLAILLAGLTLYALGVHAWLPMAQPELFPWAVMVVGMVFLVAGACELYLPKTRQQEIEERDERNISNANAAKATAYEMGTVLFAVALLVITLTGIVMVKGPKGLWGRGGVELLVGIAVPLTLFLLL